MPERRTFPFWPVLAVLGLLAFGFYHLYHILIPFLLSFAIAYILSPLISAWEAHGVRRQVTVVILFLCAATLVGLLANTVIQLAAAQFKDLQAEAPTYLARLRAFSGSAQSRLNEHLPEPLRLARRWDLQSLAPSFVERAESLPSYVLGVFPILSLALLVPFISFFLLIDGPDSINRLIQGCPSRYVEQALHVISEIDTSLGAYLRGLVIVALSIFAAAFIGLVILGVDQALTVAALAGACSFVPYLGTISGSVVGGILAGVQYGTLTAGLKVVALFALIHAGNDLLLQPFIAKHSVRLHPLVVLLTFMIGGDLFGLIGLIFAVPVACIVKALLAVAWSWYWSERQPRPSELVDAASLPYT